jgi:serine protease AprX
MSKIEINGISIDPEQQAPALANANLISADSSASNYILIQTDQPLDRQQKSDLVNLNVKILEYVPESAYICHYTPADLTPIRALPYVVWANVYLQGFKIPPPLQPIPSTDRVINMLDRRAVARSMSQETKEVEIVLHRDASATDIRDKIATAVKLDPDTLQVTDKKVRLVVQSQYLDDLAAIDEVRHIEEYLPKQLHNNIALRIMRADVTHSHTSLEGSCRCRYWF